MARFWGKVRDVVSSVAPTVATALGGPLGGIAATAIRAALGVDTDDQAMEALATDPQAVLKLRLAEVEFQKFLTEAEIRLEEIHAADRHSARTMDTANKQPQVVLSAVFIAGYFLILGILLLGYYVPHPEVAPLVNGVIGVMTAAVMAIIQFWFGSSSGSKDKDAAIAERST